MTNHKQYQQQPLNLVLSSSSGIPGAAALDKAAQVAFPNVRSSSKDEQYIVTKARETLVLELATAGIGEFAIVLSQALTVRSMQHFDEFVELDQAIRDKPRNAANQEDVEIFNHTMRHIFANTSANIVKATSERLIDLTTTPLTPPEDKEPQVIVEQEPGFFGKLFGGQKVTKVLR